VQDFARLTRCEQFREASRDEFALARFKKSAVDAIAARGPGAKEFRIRIRTNLESYDLDKEKFGFRPVSIDPPHIVGREREQSCGATHKDLPTSFYLQFLNADIIDGLPMDPDSAEALLKRRKHPITGSSNREVVAQLTIKIVDMEEPSAARRSVLFVSNYFGSPTRVEIVDMAVFENDTASTPIATLSDEQKRAYAARIAAQKAAEEEDARLNQDFTTAVLRNQFEQLKNGEDLRQSKRTRLQGHGLSIRATDDGRWVTYEIAGEIRVERQGSDGAQVLRFVNAPETKDIVVPQAVRAAARDTTYRVEARPLYVPVGVIDDDVKREHAVVAHVIGVDFSASTATGLVRETVLFGSKPEPFKHEIDERPASQFDVIGIKVREEPDTVKSKLETTFGQPMVYDATSGVLRTASLACEAASTEPNPRENTPLKTDSVDRCVTARFSTTGKGFFGGAIKGLTQIEIRQSFTREEFGQVEKSLNDRYGQPRAIDGSDFGYVAVWGARASKKRDGDINARFGTHVVEWEVRGRERLHTRFRLTDPLLFEQTEQIAPASSKPQPARF